MAVSIPLSDVDIITLTFVFVWIVSHPHSSIVGKLLEKKVGGRGGNFVNTLANIHTNVQADIQAFLALVSRSFAWLSLCI